MLTPEQVDSIKKAISAAESVEDMERLGMSNIVRVLTLSVEKALETGSLDNVKDLIRVTATPLDSLWDSSKSIPLIIQEEKEVVPSIPTVSVRARKTPREEMDEEQSKRRFLESAQLMDVVMTQLLPLLPVQSLGNPAHPLAPAHTGEMKKIVAIDVGTALCLRDDVYDPDVLVRLVLVDFLTDRVIFDTEVLLPASSEAADLRPSITGLEETPSVESSAVPFAEAIEQLFMYVSRDTVLVSYNPSKVMRALQLNHSKFLNVSDVFRVDPVKKREGEGRFHVRTILTPVQLLEAFLGEAAFDRLKISALKERMVETTLGLNRLVKALAKRAPNTLPLDIDPPRRHNTIFLTHIPSNWTDEEIRMVLPAALEVDPIEFFLDPKANEWRGETHVMFKSEADVLEAFARLTACSDVFVGWEWKNAGDVSEETLRNLGSDFGNVVGVRVQDRFLAARKVLPGREETRPFGFISMARYQDALALAVESGQIEKDGISFHVKISKKPITAFKRIPLGEGEDYIEAFIM